MQTNEEEEDDFSEYEFEGEYEEYYEPLQKFCAAKKTEREMRMEKANERIKRREKKNIWENGCTEVREEMQELHAILMQMGLPPHNYNKDKPFPITDYTAAPNIETCKSKDYLDFYVFPYLLPAIQAMIIFAKQNRIFQCRVCTFNPSDFISEFLYNSNPRHPSRKANPVPLLEAPFAKQWLLQYPRPLLPKWLTMPQEEAATIIQRTVRGHFVRKRPDVQEMRQFWRDLKKDKEEECRRLRNKGIIDVEPNYKSEVTDEDIDKDVPPLNIQPKPLMKTHSEECDICSRFNQFIKNENFELKKSVPNIQQNPAEMNKVDENVEKYEHFKNKYNLCCFYPPGHLLHTKELSGKDKLRHPSLSCIKKPRAVESKAVTKLRPLSLFNEEQTDKKEADDRQETTPMKESIPSSHEPKVEKIKSTTNFKNTNDLNDSLK